MRKIRIELNKNTLGDLAPMIVASLEYNNLLFFKRLVAEGRYIAEDERPRDGFTGWVDIVARIDRLCEREGIDPRDYNIITFIDECDDYDSTPVDECDGYDLTQVILDNN